jgi:energy-coupling factor transporter ATP-binding protein EcfA2
MTGLTAAVRAVLTRAAPLYEDDPRRAALLSDHRRRLEEPLRIAIAGKVKAGKSTLLNALVGEQVAPTDAGECTQVVTWYRDGRVPQIVAFPTAGPPVPLPVDRRDGALVIDLQGRTADELERMVVDWPAQSLRTATLIDTPGTASLTTGTSRRTVRFLNPDDDTPTEADAVVYLMRQLHASDAEFLEAFRDQGVARAASVNTLAVISRADEIGGGRVDAMISARQVAARYRREPALRGLCQNVVAVAGLVAQTGRTLRQAEFAALRALAGAHREDLDAALLTADRFTSDTGPVVAVAPGLTPAARRALLDRFGLFGLRVSTSLIRQGLGSPAELAAELLRRSGLHELQHVLHTQFAERRDLLKARSALLALDRLLHEDPRPGGAALLGDVERIFAGAHEFTELRLLSALRSGAVALPAAVVGEAERLLGEAGAGPATRLDLPAGAGEEIVRAAALDALARWQDLAENPMTARAAADACRVVIRTCEGLLVPS